MKLADIDLDLSLRKGSASIKLRAPGIAADIQFDQKAYEASVGAPADGSPATAVGLSLNQLGAILMRVAQGCMEAGQGGPASASADVDDEDGGGEPPVSQ